MRELVNKLKQHAIDLDVVNDQLRLSVPEGFDSNEIIEEIRENKEELISFIKAIKGIADFKTISPVEEKEYYVLSAAQRRLYFLYDYDKSSLTYNIPQVMKLRGELDLTRLQTAFQGLVDRHESFRTRFVMQDEEPVQMIEKDLIFELEISETGDEQEALRIVEDFVRPFDLISAPLLRAGVVKISEDEHVLMTDMHHVISDGVSMGILTEEIMALYSGAVLPALRLQYKDYSEWQQGEAAHQKLSKERSFWLDTYEELPEILNLPTDHARPRVRSFEGDTVRLVLSESETEGLKQMAKEQGTTIFTLMLSILNVFLSRLSNQQDVVVGTPIAGRFHDDLSHIVGMFVNTLPLRNYPSGEKTFASFLEEVKASSLACFDHQTYQYEELINELQINRNTGRNPLFDVMYTYQTAEEANGAEAGDLQSEPYEYKGSKAVKFDLSLSAVEYENKIYVSFSYTIDLFTRQTIERFAGYFHAITIAILEDINVKLSEIEILSGPERNLLLNDFNAIGSEYADEVTVIDLFERQAIERPDATALVFGEHSLTYHELNERSNRIANMLAEKGTGKGDLIALLFERSPEMIINIFGVLKSGAAYLPIDPKYPEQRIEYILNDSEARLLISQEGLARPESKLDQWVYNESELETYPGTSVSIPISQDDLAYVIYTSGTTGNPKGTLIEHQSIPRIVWNNNYVKIEPTDRVFQLSNYTFDGSIFDIYGALVNGAALVLIEPDKAKDVQAIREVIKREKVTVSFITSTLFNLLVTEDIQILKGFRKVLIGGEALSLPHIRKALDLLGKGRLINGYGPTESTVFAVTHDISEIDEKLLTIPIGKPVSGTQLYILNADQKLSPLGVSGELYISGSGLSRGYLNNESLTRERFLPNPFLEGARMYRTGDLARWLPDGTVEYLGRVDDQIKLRGFRIELGEIQARLASHKEVKEAAVLAKGKGSDQYLVGYYVSDEEIDRLTLKGYLSESLPDYMLPSYFVWQKAFQLTSNGKLNRKALPDPEVGVLNLYVAPANQTEEQLAAIWATVLKIEQEVISVTANFFELGGHSLRATVVVNKIRKVLQVEVPLREFFQHSDIRSLATYVLLQEKLDNTTIPKTIEKAHYALSSAQKRQYFLQQFGLESVTYNMSQVMKLRGELDLIRLQAAFQGLIDRHESFRTRFVMQDEEPVQVIEKDLIFELEISQVGSEQEASRIVEGFVRPFDLTSAPLLRAAVVKISEEEHILMTDMHHIISDGVSMEILTGEILSLYNGAILPALRLQYKDYSEWQQGEEARGKLSNERSFWLDTYQELPEMLNLPTDHIRSGVRSFAGDTVHFTLSESETQGLKQVAQEQGTTMFMTLLSIFNVLLSRLSNQQDIVVGSPTAGRFHDDLSGIVGMFVNTLPLRNHPSGEKTFASFLKEVKASTLACFDHQIYQYEELINELQINRDTGRNPLFDVVYTYHTGEDSSGVEVAGLKREPYDNMGSEIAKFDLLLSVGENENQISVSFNYAIELFTRQTIERFAGYFQTITTAILEDIDIKLSEIEIISRSERNLLLNEFNSVGSEYAEEVTVIDLFERQVIERPEAIALVFGEYSLTYRELNEQSNRVANMLSEKGTAKGDLIALLFDRSPEMIISIFGVLKSGAAYLPIDPKYPEKRVEYILSDSEAGLLISQEGLASPGSNLDHWVYNESELEAYPGTSVGIQISQDDLAYVIYTSGTTGNPKGTLIEHQSIPRIVWDNNYLKIESSDKVLQLSNYTFDGSVFDIHGALANGASLIMIQPEKAGDIEAIGHLIRQERVTVSFVTTALFNLLVTEAPESLKGFRKILFGGELVSLTHTNEALKILGKDRLMHVYGPTESTVFATAYDINTIDPKSISIPIGKPVSGTQLYILTSNQELSPIGVSGELYISGSGLSRGYLNNESLTYERFLPNPFLEEARMYKTGDLARWLPDGTVEFLGRVDDQIKLRGFRIELGEIQERLASHKEVKEAAVLANGKGSDQYLVGYYVSDEEIDRLTLKGYLSESLPDYMVPSYFVWQKAFQLTTNGKLDRKALPDPEVGAGEAYVYPANETEGQLVAIWSTVLKIEPEAISTTANFFELGGHSLKATVVVNKIRKVLEVQVTLREFFQHSDIRSLATHVLLQEKLDNTIIPKAIEKAHYALSSAQKRQYFLQQFDLESVTYNMPQVMKLRGELDLKRLESAFQGLMDRHESFRTRFVMLEEEPVQMIEKDLTFELEISETGDEQEALRIVKGFVRPFDLTLAPLLRAGVVKISEEEHILMTDMHHIISDGVSMEILIKEFLALYNGTDLTPLRLQYKDYSEWHQGEEAQQKLSNERSFWLDKYQELPEALGLPTDHARPEVRSFAGDIVHFALPESESQGLKQMAREQGTTMFMLMLSIFNVLLSRLSNQQDVVVGTPTAGRFHDDLSGIVGMFVNTLPLRNYPSGEKTFAAFLEEVKASTLACFDHQTYQYEELINELQVNRDTGRNPLFDVMYTYHTGEDSSGAQVAGLQSESYEDKGAKTVKFDLSLSAGENGRQISVSLSYASDLFTRETIERFAHYFKAITSAITRDNQIKLTDIEILIAAEKKELLFDFNDTKTLYPKHQSLTGLFELQVERTPESIALVFNEEQLTYQQLSEKANQLAHYLQAQSMPSKSVVGIMLERSTALIIAIVGTLKAGHTYLPLDPSQPEERLRQILGESNVALLITTIERSKVFNSDVQCLDIDNEEIHKAVTTNPEWISSPEELAYILYTSGSTGKPKGVMVQHRSVINLVYSQQATFNFGSDERVLQFSTIAFDASAEQIWLTLLTGNSLVLIDKDKIADSHKFNQYLIDQEVTHLHATPSFLEGVELVGANSLLRIVTGGEVCSPVLAEKFCEQYEFYNKYGPTEATVTATVYPVDGFSVELDKIPIGRPVSNTFAYVLGSSAELLPKGTTGELYLSGDCLSLGYLDDKSLTGERFIPNPYVQGERMYKTGDLVRWLPDGNLDFMGRADDQVKIRGYRIELGEIETHLVSHGQIKEATILVRGEEGDNYLVAYYLSEEAIESSSLRHHLSERLPEYMVPSYFVWQEVFPLTTSGKLDKKALPDPEVGEDEGYAPLANETEEQLVAIWSAVLKLEPEAISVTSNFFELGGHSLRATVAVNKIRKILSVEVSLRDFFRYTDIRSLANYVLSQEQLSTTTIPKASEKVHYTLSSAQKRQYFLQQFDPGSVTYNMPQVMKLRGELDFKRLGAAFQGLVDRHDSFRTRFVMLEEEPVQKIEKDLIFELEISETHDEQEALRVVKDFVRPFDLTQAPLLRAGVVKISEEEHILMTDMHHIISDGVSMGILTGEIMSLYNGTALPALRLQYKDYSEWQQGEEARERLSNECVFWLDTYKELPEILNLPTDHARPGVRSFAGDTVHFTLSESETQGLKQIAQEQGTTMFMTLLSIFNVLLSRLSSQQDIVIGTPTAGRFHDDLSGIVGMFVNTLPLRNYPSGGKTFAAFLEEVKASTLACFDHQTYQYEELINELQINRDTGRNPLFDVMYTYYTGEDSSGVEVADLELEPYEDNVSGIEKFDLSLSAGENGKQISVSLSYASALFTRQTIERFASYFQAITTAILEDIDVKLSEMEIISRSERNLLLNDFNDIGNEYTGELTVIDLFERQVIERPDGIALVFGEQSLTYRDLNEQSNRVANMLSEKGTGKGDLIALLFERSPEMIISIFGVLKNGAAYLPVDPTFPEKRVEYILSDSEAGLLISQEGLARPGSSLDYWVYSESELAAHSSKPSDIPISLGDLAYVIYTSGTTGNPKGTLIEHNSIPRIVWNNNYVNIEPSDKVLQLSNYAFDGSVFDIYGALVNGASLILVEPEKAGDIHAIGHLIRQEQVTVSFVTTALFNLLVTEAPESLKGLRKILFGGELVSLTHTNQALKILGKDRLMHVYGPTESTVFATAYDINSIDLKSTSIPIGKPVSGTQLYILTPDQELSPLGVSGELYISGKGLARGYLNNDILTQERFVPNPFQIGERMYRTGDLARWLPDGTMEFQGRTDSQVKLRGFRIELGEIETRLISHGQIREAAVFAKGKGADQYLVGYYVADSEIDRLTLKGYLSEKLPDYMVPDYYVHLEKLPLTSSGKLDRKALPEPEMLAGDAYVPPANETEEQLVTIWSTVLKMEPNAISVCSNFFELGGHSLKATVAVNKIRKVLQVEVSLGDFFRYSDIRSLATYVLSKEQLGTTTIHKASEKAHYALSSAQKRQYFLQQFDLGSVTYNMPQVMKLSGEFNLNRLEAAFQGLIDRHESFRTRFVMLEEEPVQVIEKDLTFELEISETEDKVEALRIVKDFVRPFDLTSVPLLRAGIVKMSEEEHILMIDMHHIISDGLSMEILTREFMSLYNGAVLPALRLQYKDYSEWQQGEEAVQRLSKGRSFWLDEYKELPEILNLPTDHVRPGMRSFAGDTVHFTLPESETGILKEIAQGQGTTMFMLMLSIFNVLLSRLSNQQDIVVGTPTAGRLHDDLSGIVGMFVNTLPLRNYPSGEKTFAAFLEEVKMSTLACFDHQTYQYEALIEEVKVERDPSRNPLFDVMYLYRNTEDSGGEEVPGLRLEPLESSASQTAKFDLTLNVTESDKKMFFVLDYSTELFEKKTIERFVTYFRAIVEVITSDPSVPLSTIQILPKEESREILNDFNDTKRPLESGLTIDSAFEKVVLQKGNEIATTCGGKSLSYKELNEKSNQLARGVLKLKKRDECIVGIMVPRSNELIISIMGVLKAGCAYVPIDPDYPVDRIKYIIEDSGLDVLLSDSSLRDIIDELPGDIELLDVRSHVLAAKKKENLNCGLSTSSLAYMIYTSGSTGNPKGVMIEHGNVINFVHGVTDRIPFDEGSKVLCLTTVSFDIFVLEALVPLLRGLEVVLSSSIEQKDVKSIMGLIRERQVDMVQMTPSHIKLLLSSDHSMDTFDSVKILMVGGEAFPIELLHELRKSYSGQIYNMYGPTETTVWSTIRDLTDSSSVDIGTPIANTCIRILDPDNNLVPIGTVGELCIGGRGVARGYWKKEQLTSERFITDPFDRGNIIYRTGDLARWLPEGNIQCLGRVDDQVKIRGHRIELGEVESQLKSHPEVVESAMVVHENGGDKFLAAYYVTENESSISDLREFLMDRVPKYMVPSYFSQLERIPLTPNGKVDRKALRDLEMTVGDDYVAPSNEIEERLVEIWSSVLKLDPDIISVTKGFFELGGHSLNAMAIINKIYSAFNVQYSLQELFRKPTIKAIAEYVQTRLWLEEQPEDEGTTEVLI